MTEEHIVTMVFPANVMAVWQQAAPILRPSVDRAGTHTLEDVRRSVMAGAAQLWVQWKDGKCESAVVTEFRPYPRGLWLNVWLWGADRDSKTDEEMFGLRLYEFADANQCVGFRVEGGRKGLGKLFKYLNTERTVYSVLLKDLRKAA